MDSIGLVAICLVYIEFECVSLEGDTLGSDIVMLLSTNCWF